MRGSSPLSVRSWPQPESYTQRTEPPRCPSITHFNCDFTPFKKKDIHEFSLGVVLHLLPWKNIRKLDVFCPPTFWYKHFWYFIYKIKHFSSIHPFIRLLCTVLSAEHAIICFAEKHWKSQGIVITDCCFVSFILSAWKPSPELISYSDSCFLSSFRCHSIIDKFPDLST